MEFSESLFPDLTEGGYFNVPGYGELIASFGYEVVFETDDHDYQGYSYLVLKDGHRYGYLTYGWGSCSGCDARQGCTSIDEVKELWESLNQDIRWFDSLRELYSAITDTDFKLYTFATSRPAFKQLVDMIDTTHPEVRRERIDRDVLGDDEPQS